jgi:hypothetical protein
MSERSPERPPTAPRADVTRDIRLPPLPDRPAPAVPPAWSSYLPAAPADPAPAAPAAGATAVGAAPAPEPPAAPHIDAAPPGSVDEPTDRLASPSDSALRQSTRTFSPPPSVQLLKVSVGPTKRRTTKVLWTLIFLTLAVIIACGVYLVVLVNQR